MTEEGYEKSSMHRYYYGGYGATPNPLAAYDDDAAEDGQTTNTSPTIATTAMTNAGYAHPPPPRQYHHQHDPSMSFVDPNSPDMTTATATTPTTSPTTAASSSSAWTRGGGPGSIGPKSTIIPPAPSPLASPVLSPLDPPTPIGGDVMTSSSSFVGNDNDNDHDSAGTSESVLDAMESAMMIDGMNTSTPMVSAAIVASDNVGIVVCGGEMTDISQPVLGSEAEGGMGGGECDVDHYDEYNEHDMNRRRQRRRSNTMIQWEDNATTGHHHADASHHHPLRSSASATLQTTAYSLASSSTSPPPLDGGYRDTPQRQQSPRSSAALQPTPCAVPPHPTAMPPPSRFVSSASAPSFGGHRGGGGVLGNSHSFGSLHSELHSEGGCSESDSGGCASPPTGRAFVAGGAGGGGGLLVAAGTTSAAAATTHVSFATSESSSSSSSAGGRTIVDKRQRRLERNRESARVSRRRRKFYLEELECKVTVLSEEMDVGRMAHASAAVRTIRDMRSNALDDAEGLLMSWPSSSSRCGDGMSREDSYTVSDGHMPPVRKSSGIHHNVVVPQVVNDYHHCPIGAQLTPPATMGTATSTSSLEQTANVLITNLSRTSAELQVVQTFMKQHLLSLVQPTSTRFLLWLSLQDDVFYRGGRSASERLSAARIGERLLHSGTDRASPNTNMMWPLVCHEISLSYEQEEKVRGVQRTILSNADCWIHRHTALATRYVIEGVHDVVCGAHAAARKRERSLMQILTPEQRVRFLGWARRRGDIRRLAEINSGGGGGERTTVNFGDDDYRTSPDGHIAANLYMINHFLSKVKQQQKQRQQELGALATLPVVVHPTKLKKLSRRPSLESLAGLQAAEDAHDAKMSREHSFPSSGSLKRSLSSMASLADGSHADSIDPNTMNFSNGGSISLESAQSAGQAAVMILLRDVLPIVPKEAWYNPPLSSAARSTFHPPTSVTSQPLPMPQAYQLSAFAQGHIPKSIQHAQQPEGCTSSQSHQMQHASSVTRAAVTAQPQYKEYLISDIPDVDDIPMPTPVSVLLRTSDDYLMTSPVYEQEEEPQLDAVVSSSSGLTYGAADGFSMPERTGYSSYVNTNAGLYRPQSAPQLEAFAQTTDSNCPSLRASHHMAMIPEMEVVMSHPGVATGDHGDTGFAIPEQINSSYSYTANTCLLGSRHQSAPQFGTFARSSYFYPDPSLPTAPDVSVMPEVAYNVPGGDDIIGEFEMLEELNFMNQTSNMVTDDWAIGEGFDDDVTS